MPALSFQTINAAAQRLSSHRSVVRPAGAVMPLRFEANRGQSDPSVKYLAQGAGYGLFLTAGEAIVALSPGGCKASILRMRIAGANRRATVNGEGESRSRTNYFIGNDPSKWTSGPRAYERVRYRSVYPGIDLIYYGTDRRLEYDFVVAPGAAAGKIVLAFEGGARARVDGTGDLLLRTDSAEVRWLRPVAYQVKGGKRTPVSSRYSLNSAAHDPKSQTVSFKLGPYDHSLPLVIDPILQYSSFLGGNTTDLASFAALDTSGCFYVAGLTYSQDFPVKNGVGSFVGASSKIFIAKFDTTKVGAASLLYSTMLGGNSLDDVLDMKVDDAGQVYLTGTTQSTNFPTAHAIRTNRIGISDAFVVRIDTTNSGVASLAYSTYLGGANDDFGTSLVLEGAGTRIVHVLGGTTSTDFPVTSATAYQPAKKGSRDLFLTKIDTDLSGVSSILYSTYFGGDGDETSGPMLAEGSGIIDVVGSTTSINLPTRNAFQSSLAVPGANSQPSDAFVARFDTTQSGSASLLYSTYLGGTGQDYGDFIGRDASGFITISGESHSPDFPLRGQIQAGKATAVTFIARLDLSKSGNASLLYSTCLGGSGGDIPYFMAVDPGGDVYVAGITQSNDYPTKNAFQSVRPGLYDAYVSRVDPSKTGADSLVYSTYLGASAYEYRGGYAYDGAGGVYLAGYTTSPDFPTRNGLPGIPWGSQVFVSQIDTNKAGADSLAFSTLLGGINNPSTAQAIALDAAGIVYVAGSTGANDFPIVNGAQTTASGGYDAFVAKLTPPSLLSSLAFQFNPAAGGVALNGIVSLDKPTIDNVTVSLASDNASATVPASVIIPAGSASATFPISTTSVATAQIATVSATANQSSVSKALSIEPGIVSLALSPNVTDPCHDVTATVTLNGTAGSDIAVSIVSANPAAVVPDSIVIPAGESMATFTVNVGLPATTTTGDITAQFGGMSASATLTVKPIGPVNLEFSSKIVLGGSPAIGTVVLNCPAAPGDVVVSLSSSNTSLASVPASLTVPAGTTSASFNIATKAVTLDTPVTISAVVGDVSASSILTVAAPRKLVSVKLSLSSVTGGAPTTGTLTLNLPALPGGTAAFISSNSAAATVPASATVPEGSVSATFAIGTVPVAAITYATIAVKAGGVTKTVKLTVKPAVLMSLAIKPNSLVGGNLTTGTITMTGVCKVDTIVALSSNSATAAVPASVTVPGGSASTTFAIETSPVAAKVAISITASQGGVTRSAPLTVSPPALSSVTLSPNPVKGGNTVTGTVNLTGPAAVNTVVSLKNANAKAQLPNGTNSDTVTVAAGNSTATFTMTTHSTVIIVKGAVSATLGTVTKSVTLSVSP